MKHIHLLVAAALAGPAADPAITTFRTQSAAFGLDAKGSLCTLSRHADARRYLAPHQPAPLLGVRIGGKLYSPGDAAWDARAQRLILRFPEAGATAVMAAEAKPTPVVFEVMDPQPTHRVELVLWGPYPTTIGDVIGSKIARFACPAA